MIKDKFSRSGKEQYRQLDTPKTEEKTTTVNAEGNKSEAQKKKKNIIRVFHAQNASDGRKGRRNPAAGEKNGPARSQNGGQRPAGQGTRNNESGEQRNSQGGANRTQGGRPQGNRPEGRRDGNRDGRSFEGRRDGGNPPFYPDHSLPPRARAQALRDEIYETMVGRSKESDCEYIRYVKKEAST